MAGIFRQLEAIYTNPSSPGSFTGINKLYQSARAQGLPVKLNDVKNFLLRQAVYTKHRPRKRHHEKQQVRLMGPNHYGYADLMDLKRHMGHNNKYRYILVIIDGWSKFVLLEKLTLKDGSHLAKAIETLFTKYRSQIPIYLFTDNGKEFNNKQVIDKLKSFGTYLILSRNPDTKSMIAERVIQTLGRKLEQIITKK